MKVTIIPGRGPYQKIITGWTYDLVKRSINGPNRRPLDDRYVTGSQCVERQWSGRVNGKGSIGFSSVITSKSEFVVFIVDCAARYAIARDGHDHGWRVTYMSRTGLFGGSAHYDTHEEAIAAYDRIRGAAPEQTAFF